MVGTVWKGARLVRYYVRVARQAGTELGEGGTRYLYVRRHVEVDKGWQANK